MNHFFINSITKNQTTGMQKIIRTVLYYFSMHNTIFYICAADIPFLHFFQNMLIPFNFRLRTVILYIIEFMLFQIVDSALEEKSTDAAYYSMKFISGSRHTKVKFCFKMLFSLLESELFFPKK